MVYNSALEEVKKDQAEWEAKTVLRIPEVDKEALERYKRSELEGIGYLDGFCWSHADFVVQAWWKLGDDLFVRFNKLGYYDSEKRTLDRNRIIYPEWWKKAIKVWDAVSESADKQ